MPKDYYLILGVPRDADHKRIKQAYRRLARRFHPDTAGSNVDTEAFLEARRAYEVLADPRLRETHDRKLRETEKRQGLVREVLPLRDRPHTTDPQGGVDSLFRNLAGSLGSSRAISAELVLDQFEAANGGAFILPMPMDVTCPHCGGRGVLWKALCRGCRGRGSTAFTLPIRILLPPHTPDRAEVVLSVGRNGPIPCALHLRVVVQPR